ncbi:hypothetical protein [Streptomyces griseocarneus]|uniref:hypothetical protein n=1 Tax=Streptomyces griseocarneus TaxID=51201 RepID=UPI00167C7C24|nr:hypothetical protein [Streptomyces griseocarneus]MBZ6472049.1 hypothetical protein [Streptomyces griseocarneus]GHG72244.1 membrane protein [Streptomyces griseocarneus]
MSTEGGTPGGGPDKRQRKHSPLAVASVAAAVLLAGGGGAYWASTAGHGDGGGAPGAAGGSGRPAPLELDGYGTPGAGGGASQGIAVGEPDPHGVRYRASGSLPDGPRTAPVHLPEREVSSGEVAALAKALDVRGTPRLVKDTWTVGGGPDAAGPTLQVSRQGPGDWAYSKYGVPGGTTCAHPPGAGSGEQGSQGTSPGLDSPAPACPSFRDGAPATDPGAAGPVSEEKAKSVVAPVFKALGQDGTKVGARAVYGAVRTVTADPRVNSTPTYGWQTSLQVGADAQVVGGSGRLQLPKKGAAYPLLTARQAMEELNRGAGTGRVAVGGCATAVPFRDGDGGGDAPCEGKRDAREPVAVTGAVFGLSAQSVSGRQALVPSWLFTAKMPGADDKAEAVTIAQPAIDPKFIAKTPPFRSGGPSGSASATSGPVRVDAYTVEEGGRKLVLHFWGGVCSTYAASAEQSSSAVTVKVTGTEKEPGRACVLIAKRMETTVTLEEPLGDRKVVDLSSGESVRERQGK